MGWYYYIRRRWQRYHSVVMGTLVLAMFLLATFKSISRDYQDNQTIGFKNAHIHDSVGGINDTENGTVHVALIVEVDKEIALLSLINSVMIHTDHVVRWHIISCNKIHAIRIKNYLHCFKFAKASRTFFDVLDVVPVSIFDSVDKEYGKLTKHSRKCPDLIVLKLHNLFPRLNKLLYLDVDSVVTGDIGLLWRDSKTKHWITTMKNERENMIRIYLSLGAGTSDTLHAYRTRYKRDLSLTDISYDISVLSLNLLKWRSQWQTLAREFHFWMKQGIRLNLHRANHSIVTHNGTDDGQIMWWDYGALPITWLTFSHLHRSNRFGGDFLTIDGGEHERRNNASVVLTSWKHTNKPYNSPDAHHRDVWRSYLPVKQPCALSGTIN